MQDYDDAEAAFKEAQATVQQDRAAVEAARINLAFTRVTAPITGRIGISTVTRGALVTANQTTALDTIQQLDPIYVDLTQSVTEVSRCAARSRRARSTPAGPRAPRPTSPSTTARPIRSPAASRLRMSRSTRPPTP